MKILELTVDNFLRLGQVHLDLSGSWLHVLGGLNEAGKSSINEAIRFALLGETVRVAKKSDYKHLIKDGAKTGTVRIKTDTGDLIRDIKSAKICGGVQMEIAPALPFVLNAPRFLQLDTKKRRDLLFEVCGVTHDQDTIRKLLVSRGLNEGYVDQIMPMIRAGFDAAMSAAKRFASESRGAWKTCTGETYGSLKADGWRPTLEPFDPAKSDSLEQDLADVDARLIALREAMNGDVCKCPACAVELRIVGAELQLHDGSNEVDPTQAEQQISELFDQFVRIDAKVDLMRLIKQRNDVADKTAQQAEQYAVEVRAWTALADALAPDGVPGELLSDHLKPVNARLQKHAVDADWPQVMITPDLDVLIEGRSYLLQSRSAQWRTQAMIAETLAYLSGCGLLLLDEFDVLDMNHRRQMLAWISGLGADYETVLLIGTLKEPPGLPEPFIVHWLEQGVLKNGK